MFGDGVLRLYWMALAPNKLINVHDFLYERAPERFWWWSLLEPHIFFSLLVAIVQRLGTSTHLDRTSILTMWLGATLFLGSFNGLSPLSLLARGLLPESPMRLSLATRWLPIEPTHTLPTLMRVPYPLSIAEGLSLVARADYNLGGRSS